MSNLWFICVFALLTICGSTPMLMDEALKGSISLNGFLPSDVLVVYFSLYEEPADEIGYGQDQEMFPDFCIFNEQPCTLNFNETAPPPIENKKTLFGYLQVAFSHQKYNMTYDKPIGAPEMVMYLWTNFLETNVTVVKPIKDGKLMRTTMEVIKETIPLMQSTDAEFEMQLRSLIGEPFDLNTFREAGNSTALINVRRFSV